MERVLPPPSLRRPSRDWHAFTLREVERIRAEAAHRDYLEQFSDHVAALNPDRNYLAVLGEAVYAVRTGQRLHRHVALGDGGEDYDGVDVKASAASNPRLIVERDRLKAPVYCLVELDMRRDLPRGRISGFATKLQLLVDGRTHDFGHGARLYLPGSALFSYNPEAP